MCERCQCVCAFLWNVAVRLHWLKTPIYEQTGRLIYCSDDAVDAAVAGACKDTSTRNAPLLLISIELMFFVCTSATLANCLPLLIAHLIRSLWVSLLASCLSLCACVCLSSLSGCLVPCDDWHQHDLHDCLVSVPMMSFGWLFLTEWLTEITCWWWRWKLWTGVCKLRFSQLNNFFFFLHFLPFFCLPDCLLQLHCHFPRLVCYCLPAPVFACFVSIRLKFLPFSPFCCLFRSCIHTPTVSVSAVSHRCV